MSNPRIVGIILVKNEEFFIKQSITNVLDFCDDIIVLDNNSGDNTYQIIEEMSHVEPKIYLRKWDNPNTSSLVTEKYYNTNTWLFGVDGDEIYDPEGLVIMREKILNGDLNNIYCVKGNVLNCTSIDIESKTATGYTSPPARSMTKLYNCNIMKSTGGVTQRLHTPSMHGGLWGMTLGAPSTAENVVSEPLFESYDTSYFRCLHLCFLKRSSQDANVSQIFMKDNVTWRLAPSRSKVWKYEKYRQGEEVEKDISVYNI